MPYPRPVPEYAVLIYPAANRVYAETSTDLLRAEIGVLGEVALSTLLSAVRQRDIGGVPYITFHTEMPLDEQDVRLLSNVSTLYALFELDSDVLRPVTIEPTAALDSDLLTIQKYSGKTNELFTKLLLNLTLLTCADPAGTLRGPTRVLDPLCGRGTTLNQAMMYGFDATGIELDGKDFEAYCQFIKTWLRAKRLKHTAEITGISKNKIRLGRRLDIEYGLDKQRYKAGESSRVSYLNCDTLRTAELLKRDSVELIVTDLPYGVQHGSHRPQQGELSRDPKQLLAAALPGWLRVLRPGGGIGISWNTNVTKRADLLHTLREAGLEVREGGPFEHFAHRVDQAITRDLVVARNPR